MLNHQKARKRVSGKLLVIHCPADMKDAVDRAAKRDMISIAAYARQAIRDRLQAENRLRPRRPQAVEPVVA